MKNIPRPRPYTSCWRGVCKKHTRTYTHALSLA